MGGHAKPEEEFEPVAGDDGALIPEGKYSVVYKGGTIRRLYKERRLVAEFEISSPGSEYHNVRLPFYAAVCPEGSKRPNLRKKFYRAWCLANGSPPGRGDRMTLKAFAGGKLFKCKVETAKNNGIEYSVVRELLEVENRNQ